MTDEFKDNVSTIDNGVAEDTKLPCTYCPHYFKESELRPFACYEWEETEYPLCSTCIARIEDARNQHLPDPSPLLACFCKPSSHDIERCFKCVQYLSVVWLLFLVTFFIPTAIKYFPTLNWEMMEGVINSPCVVEYEVDGQSYTYKPKKCVGSGPYKLKYNPQDPSDAISAGQQNVDKIGLIAVGCLLLVYPFLVVLPYLCYVDIATVPPMLKRIFRRS